MAEKKEETASFVLRFTQKIFESENGEHQVQWRGTVRHVQEGTEIRFSKFEDAEIFIQKHLKVLTEKATEDKPPEEQKGILEKSFNLWKKVALGTPKMVFETIRDPKKSVAQIQQQISEVGEDIGHQIEERIGRKFELDDWAGPTRSDHQAMMEALSKISSDVRKLSKKVQDLSKRIS